MIGVTASGVTVRRAGRALVDAVSTDFEPGALTALLGPNGAGKTTLLRVLARDLAPDTGHVTVDGRALATFADRDLARCRAVLPQTASLAFGLTAMDVVRLGRLPWDEPSATTDAHARDALRTVELLHAADRSWLTLSGGERQRVQIARVLAQIAEVDRAVVLLDEPTNHLDLAHQLHVLRLGRTLADRGLTVIAVLHDLALAARVADDVKLLVDGRLVAEGPPARVLDPARIEAVFGVRVDLVQHGGRAIPLPHLEPPC
ncbi:MAG: heme ABC transporter ATP-binding protein [Alphaproteobacteria bacterium]|nr:heme ABC transporter ATP-binding protein [Alphaproteobacteria bacterium]MCB9692270.1 heme ABC transporter ATP-binding protein [Alphaproteobacteria bacterium]